MLTRTAIFSLLVLAVGCAGQTRTFDIAVHNNSTKPLTLVLAKEGGPKDPVWATPEDVVAAGPSSDGQWGFGVVPAGKSASNSSVTAKLPSSANAYLRIYVGDLNLGEALKIAPGSPERLDITLKPGKNDFVVIDHDSGIELEGVESATQPATEPATAPTSQPAEAATAPATEPAK